MALLWNKLRSFNSSQHNAFEELVCQLANTESIEKKNKYVDKKLYNLYLIITNESFKEEFEKCETLYLE